MSICSIDAATRSKVSELDGIFTLNQQQITELKASPWWQHALPIYVSKSSVKLCSALLASQTVANVAQHSYRKIPIWIGLLRWDRQMVLSHRFFPNAFYWLFTWDKSKESPIWSQVKKGHHHYLKFGTRIPSQVARGTFLLITILFLASF